METLAESHRNFIYIVEVGGSLLGGAHASSWKLPPNMLVEASIYGSTESSHFHQQQELPSTPIYFPWKFPPTSIYFLGGVDVLPGKLPSTSNGVNIIFYGNFHQLPWNIQWEVDRTSDFFPDRPTTSKAWEINSQRITPGHHPPAETHSTRTNATREEVQARWWWWWLFDVFFDRGTRRFVPRLS